MEPWPWSVFSVVVCGGLGVLIAQRLHSPTGVLMALAGSAILLALVGWVFRRKCPRCQGLGLQGRPEQPPPKCHRCGYNLTGLSAPRCPECGCAIGFDKTFEELGLTEEETRTAIDRPRPKRS